MFNKKRVLLIIKDDKTRDLLNAIIGSDIQYKVVGMLNTHVDARSQVRRLRPDAIIMDLMFTETENAIKTIWDITKLAMRCRILIFSEERKAETIFSCFRAGASGYILKNEMNYAFILKGLSDLLSGGAPLSAEISRLIVKSFHTSRAGLSKREHQVLLLMAEGKSYREVSEELLISNETSKSHIKNIYQKLNVHDRAAAIAASKNKGIIGENWVRKNAS